MIAAAAFSWPEQRTTLGNCPDMVPAGRRSFPPAPRGCPAGGRCLAAEGVRVARSDGSGDRARWRVFISHTSELRDFPAGMSYVAAVERAITACGHVIADLADFPATDRAPAELCADRVRGCDVYVGVLGTRYGHPVQDKPEVSYTELEFDTATEAGLDRLVFLLDTGAADVGIPLSALIDREFGARQEAFRRRVRDSGLVTQTFASPAALGQLVERSLRELAEGRRRRSSGIQDGQAPGPTGHAGEVANDLQDSGRVYISYRRTDTAPFAGRLYDYLAEIFGIDQVFMDVDSIRPGVDFAGAIEQAVTSCEVLLVLIGSHWLDATDQEGHLRIEDPHDLVRLEIETALHNQIHVVPVLADGSRLPRPLDLPTEIQDLARRQAFELGNEHFRLDASTLISYLSNVLRTRTKQLQRTQTFLVPRSRIFVSYSHMDQHWLDRLLVHLRPLERKGRLELWSDRQIRAGDEWREEIKKAIQSCQAAVLLISADFMASDFIYNDELTPLLEAGKKRGVRIIPILVSSSYYEDSTLSKFQAVNDPSEPLDILNKGQQEASLVKVYRAVRDALNANI